MVDRYLRERSSFWQNIRFHVLKFSELLNFTLEVQKTSVSARFKGKYFEKVSFSVMLLEESRRFFEKQVSSILSV